MAGGGTSDSDGKKDRKRRRKGEEERKNDRKHRSKPSSSSDDSSDYERRKRRKSKSRRKKQHRRQRSTSSSSSSSESDSNRRNEVDVARSKKKAPSSSSNLLEKLAARGETLEEREERRAKRRAAKISAKFGYTADENPFNDPNLHVAFTWKKKEEKAAEKGDDATPHSKKQDEIFGEIEKVRKRRQERELQFEEMERIRREESRMKELENYDEWARKEEEFHLLQQRQRSAIRLVEGREKPVDVLAKNLLMFGLSDEDKTNQSTVKYQERYNAMNELESLEAELEEPHNFLKLLKLHELEEVLADIDAFRTLEREASTIGDRNDENPVLKYWDALYLVAEDEVKFLRSGGAGGSHAQLVHDIRKLFEGQSFSALIKMREEINNKLQHGGVAFGNDGGVIDKDYWRTVNEQLGVHLAKMELSEIHSKMLVRQLERLEEKKEELKKKAEQLESAEIQESPADEPAAAPPDVASDVGNLEEELGLTNEVDLLPSSFSWQDKFRPRKPRYFNRVKTGYDWNKYNQTHFDHDNPPPKIVQGYKFNVFYPDLVDPTKTPQYHLEPADTDEFCILRFHAGPPYEDIAFKIVNREWNKSRKHGFRSTFERGVLSLYFNFTTHWYRR